MEISHQTIDLQDTFMNKGKPVPQALALLVDKQSYSLVDNLLDYFTSQEKVSDKIKKAIAYRNIIGIVYHEGEGEEEEEAKGRWNTLSHLSGFMMLFQSQYGLADKYFKLVNKLFMDNSDVFLMTEQEFDYLREIAYVKNLYQFSVDNDQNINLVQSFDILLPSKNEERKNQNVMRFIKFILIVPSILKFLIASEKYQHKFIEMMKNNISMFQHRSVAIFVCTLLI
jgi:hypothetical protein